ncbi:MAG: hypothetical protein N2C14_34250, partial [Planctomycetales bacterium]
LCVTYTGRFRNPHYHLARDLPDTIDYDRFTRVVSGLDRVIKTLTESTPPPRKKKKFWSK